MITRTTLIFENPCITLLTLMGISMNIKSKIEIRIKFFGNTSTEQSNMQTMTIYIFCRSRSNTV